MSCCPSDTVSTSQNTIIESVTNGVWVRCSNTYFLIKQIFETDKKKALESKFMLCVCAILTSIQMHILEDCGAIIPILWLRECVLKAESWIWDSDEFHRIRVADSWNATPQIQPPCCLRNRSRFGNELGLITQSYSFPRLTSRRTRHGWWWRLRRYQYTTRFTLLPPKILVGDDNDSTKSIPSFLDRLDLTFLYLFPPGDAELGRLDRQHEIIQNV
jgi:hypothetical protein